LGRGRPRFFFLKETEKEPTSICNARILPPHWTGTDDDDDDDRLSRIYKPVPQDYQMALAADAETRRIMEFASDWQPCFLPGGTNTCPTNPLSINDNFTKMKKMYAEAGGRPDNIRRGWLRTRL